MSKIEEFFEKAIVAGCIPQTPMNYDTVAYKIYTSHLENKVDELKAENAELRARLEKAVELPFFQKDGEVIVLIYKNKDGIVLIETYIEDEYYNGKRGKEAAEARLKELQEKGK